MTESEYQALQLRLRFKLKNNEWNGNKREAYQAGIKSAMSIVKDIHECEKRRREAK